MFSSCRIDILHFSATVDAPAELIGELRALWPPWCGGQRTSSAAHFRVSVHGAVRSRRYCIEQDGTLLGTPRRRDEVLAYLDRAINAAAVATLGHRYLLMHAGAIAYRGRGCVLPAPSGSGKTTLVAALIASGCNYFSDEVAVIDRESSALFPFPKPLSVKSGSRRALARAYPALGAGAPRRRIDNDAVWPLAPPADAWPARAVPLRMLVVPRFVPRSPTSLEPVSASTLLPDVLPQVADPWERDGRNVRVLVRSLESVRCYRLTFGRLGTAVRHIKDALSSDP